MGKKLNEKQVLCVVVWVKKSNEMQVLCVFFRYGKKVKRNAGFMCFFLGIEKRVTFLGTLLSGWALLVAKFY